MATMYVWNYLSLTNDGSEITAKHGAATDDAQTPFSVTVTGKVLQLKGTLATATVAQLWTSSLAPATFLYGHFWSDQICYLQRITAGGSIIDKIAADQPKTFPGYSACLPSASTTPITGGTEPTAVALASLYLGNYSGTTLNYALSLIL